MNRDKWITSLDQAAPVDVIERLRVPPERVAIIATLFDPTAGERWVGAAAVVVYDGGEIEVMLFDDDGTLVVRAPWALWFLESWSSELDEGLDATEALAVVRAAIEQA